MSRTTIHDLGYRRYLGSRRPQSTRWRVIAHREASIAWKGWWRLKIWVVLAAMTVVGVGVVMYVSRNDIIEQVLMRGGQVRFADALLPMSFDFFNKLGFLVTLTTTAGSVARDLRSSAFAFYFARPVRAVDYVAGKVAGATLMLGAVLFLPPLVLALYRVGLSRDVSEIIPALAMIPKMLLPAVLATVTFAVMSLAAGSLSNRPGHAIAGWAAFYLLFGSIVHGIGIAADLPELGALDPAVAIVGIAHGLFDVELIDEFKVVPPAWASATSLAVYISASLGVLWFRVKSAYGAGIGGAG